MSALNENNGAGSHPVMCETLDNAQMPVDHDVIRLSHTFTNMCADLGLDEHDAFPGVFPVPTVHSRTFRMVVDWCKEHKDEPEPVIEKDPLSRECKWFPFTDYDKTFFDVPMPELFDLVTAANYLEIPRLLHYACQAVAACIKGKRACEIGHILQQKCDLEDAQIRKSLRDNPWLEWPGTFPGAPIEYVIDVPSEMLVIIFEKLPREDLERLQLVSTKFDDVIVSSSELSEKQGPLRVVTKVEFGTYSRDRCSQRTDMWLRDGTIVSCMDYENLAKRLKFSTVQKTLLTLRDGYAADVEDLSVLLPIKAVWKNATVKAYMACSSSSALFEYLFTHLLLCKEIVFSREGRSFIRTRPCMRLPAIVACNKLDIGALSLNEDRIQPADVVEWLEHEILPEKKWSEPRQMIIDVGTITGGIDGQLTALKTAFSASSNPKPYVVHIHGSWHVDEVLENEKTHERLSIRIIQNREVIVERT